VTYSKWNGNPAYSFCSFMKVGTSKKHMAMRRGASNKQVSASNSMVEHVTVHVEYNGTYRWRICRFQSALRLFSLSPGYGRRVELAFRVGLEISLHVVSVDPLTMLLPLHAFRSLNVIDSQGRSGQNVESPEDRRDERPRVKWASINRTCGWSPVIWWASWLSTGHPKLFQFTRNKKFFTSDAWLFWPLKSI
jgi:hypothetical protein